MKELETGGQITGASIRTYAAIHLRVPMSEHDWLNKMIRESQRMEFAKAAMRAELPNVTEFPDEHWRNGVAGDAFRMADAMLAGQEKKT